MLYKRKNPVKLKHCETSSSNFVLKVCGSALSEPILLRGNCTCPRQADGLFFLALNLSKIAYFQVINKYIFDLQFPRLLMAFYWFYRPMETLCLYQRALKIFLALKRYVTFPWL